jgi:hypothetical protein
VARFDHIRVQRALGEELRIGHIAAASLKTSMNRWPIRLRFSCGSSTPARSPRNSVASTTRRSMSEVAAEGRFDEFAFVLAEQAVVDEDAGELVADRLVDQGRGDGRIHAAAEPADHALVAHLLADPVRSAVGEVRHPPGAGSRRSVEEIAEHVRCRAACA